MGDATSHPADDILNVIGLSRTIATDTGAKTIIDSFSWDFKRGQVYTIVGPSGSGKSSLLRLLNRLDEKSEGEIIFNSKSSDSYPVTELRSKIALVFQTPYLFPGTVESNLRFCCQRMDTESKESLKKLLARVGLDENLLERSHEKLSVGQKQRIALARSLALEPDIVLLDEPTSALDPGAARTIEDLILKLNRELGLTIIMVTHNFQQALRLKGISLVLVEGRLIETGDSEELFNNPKNELTRKFIAGDLV